MDFSSDNAHGVWPEMLAALADAGKGTAAAYGNDEITARIERKFSALFEREVHVFPVISGTAANALALATLVPPHGAIFCHADSHIAVDECGAPEFFTHGAKLVLLAGENGKLDSSAIATQLPNFRKGVVHNVQPACVSIAQATELGTVYSNADVAQIATLAHSHGMKVHMDGARFANALAQSGSSPADATWRAGVDVLSFGATKNGALGAEAVIFFNANDVSDFAYRRKKAGHLVSKMRFVSAQLEAYLAEDRWLRHAGRANQNAQKLGQLLSDLGIAPVAPVEANAVFARLPNRTIARLRAAGARFLDWEPRQAETTLIRLVTSSETPEGDLDRFIKIVRETL